MDQNSKKSCCAASREPGAPRKQGQVEQKEGTKEDLKGMVALPGGCFLMGTEEKEGFPADGEGPVREVTIDAFHIGSTTVTNAEFESFVRATGYQTDAERFGWSFVFYGLLSADMRNREYQVAAQTPWWCAIPEARWDQPEGPGSSIQNRMDHPVVQVSWNDAMAYCHWVGKRLPTEAEWEYAARGGLQQQRFPWGDELTPDGQHYCNIWQGTFPQENTLEDGYLGTAPARSFPPNGYGLYNTSGNVWEWCQDWFSPDFHQRDTRKNPKGPAEGTAKVMRGGSFLCHSSYCNRYRVGARSANTQDSGTSNMGFRCVV